MAENNKKQPEKQANIRNFDNENSVVIASGHALEGEELEEFCKRKGLCPLCARTQTRRKVYKLFKRSKWEPLTISNKKGELVVYKGFCLKENCFTMDQALRMTGDQQQKMVAGKIQPRPFRVQNRRASNGDYVTALDKSLHGGNAKVYPPKELKDIREEHPSSDDRPQSIIEQTIQALTTDYSISILDLSCIQLRNIDLTSLSSALRINTTLESLILANCQLDDEQIAILGKGLADAGSIPLVKLYLRANQIGDSGIDSLCPFLEKTTTLAIFNVSKNEVSTMGAVAIFNAFHRNTKTKIVDINLAQNVIWDLDEGRFGVRSFLSKNRTLKVLNLEANYINTEGIQSLTRGVLANEKGTLETLYLGHNAIGDDGAILLAQMLEEDTTIRYLGLADNEIRNGGARAFLAALATNETIHEIAGLWRNKIDRRFIVVAIRRLLLAHSSTHQEEPDHASATRATSSDSLGSSTKDERISPLKSQVGPMPHPRANGIINKYSANADDAKDEYDTFLDRLTIFQSAPLAYYDKETNIHKAIPLQDFRHEASLVTEALSQVTNGSTIQVSVRPASLGEFSKFLAERDCRVMHFSGYGHPDYVTFENGYGLLHKVSQEELSKLLAATDCSLQVVIVSSHNAHSLGQAFLNAGVPHVICCERDDVFRDLVIADFTRTLYRSLATMKTLKQAFEESCKSINVSVYAKNKRRLMDRFHLLPLVPEDDSFHDVPVFFTGKAPTSELITRERISHLPKLSRDFLGREVDMFDILESLRADDCIRISGQPGNGKDMVVAAACDYAIQRKEAFMIDDIFWLPPPKGVDIDQDSLYGDLCRCVEVLRKRSEVDLWDSDETILECRDRIDIEFEDKRALLVVDDKLLNFEGVPSTKDSFEEFLSHLLNASQTKLIKILSISDAGSTMSLSSNTSRFSRGSRIEEANIEINPLDFRSTAMLFGRVSKFISGSGCPAAHSATEFAEIAEPPFITRMPNGSDVVSQRRSDLFVRMGSGIPSAIISAATTLTKQDFVELIKIANIPEVYIDSLGSLERSISLRSMEREAAIREKNYMRAMNLKKIIEELEEMRHEFPTIRDLKQEEEVLKQDLADAVSKRRYDEANAIKRELTQLKKKINKERNDSSKGGKDAAERMDEVQAQIQSIIDGVNLEEQSQLASFTIQSDVGDCQFIIDVGEVFDFTPSSSASGIIVWANESCELGGNYIHESLIHRGGKTLLEDVSSLPLLMETEHGPVRCSTGNAVIVGPEKYGDLAASCLILAVGPLSPSNVTDAIDDNTDTLHYIKIMLRSSYRSSLVLARHSQMQALGLTLLTTRKTGKAYKETLQIGLKTLVEEVRFSSLTELRVMATSSSEAMLLIGMMSEMGHRRS